jgi:hypothetical protein
MRLCGVALPVLLSLLGPSVFGGIIRTDVPDSTYQANAVAFPQVAALYAQTTSGPAAESGSCVLVRDQWVLTAAHNFDPQWGITSMTVRFGSSVDSYTKEVAVDRWVINPGYVMNAPGQSVDLALVHLVEPITDITPAQIYTGTLNYGDILTLCGYGRPGTAATGELAFDGIKRAGTNRLTAFGGDGTGWGSSFISGTVVEAFDDRNWPQVLPSEIGLSHGDSGGWAGINVGGQDYLVGINGFIQGNLSPGMALGYVSGETLVQPNNYWIGQTTSVPEPASLGLLALGAFGLLHRRRKQDNSGRVRMSFNERSAS